MPQARLTPAAPRSPLILIIVKKFYDYDDGYCPVSTGLLTSAKMIVDMLLMQGHRAVLKQAIDANCIDRLVAESGASKVILEALWVTPAKMKELIGLHPAVEWVVRIHSEIAFLANEGISIDWAVAYTNMGVSLGFNSQQTLQDFQLLQGDVFGGLLYLPNYYPVRQLRHRVAPSSVLRIGCFGAIRPMKNQLAQGFAALRYALDENKPLEFHMNGTRQEQGGNNNLKSITALMAAADARLVLHPWMDHEDFLNVVASMDLCMQVSLSESFNIVSADAVSMGVPLVGSAAVRWLPKRSIADFGSVDSMVGRMKTADSITVAMNHDALERYVEDAVKVWNNYLA